MEMTSLNGKVVAVPEYRQLELLVDLLQNRGAEVLQVPLVAILDAPDPQPVLTWLERFIAAPPDLFILFTGEGLKRLLDLAERHGRREPFVAALAATRKLCRGPKPERVLRTLAQQTDIPASEPTTDGIIATLAGMELGGQRVAVQLYGEEPNLKLVDYLADRGASVDTVAPYVYASKEDEARVLALIGELEAGQVDVVMFTSQPQYKRLVDVAKLHGHEQALHEALNRTVVAAIGPLVAAQLNEAGVNVAIMPDKTYFMKPLVTAIMRHFDKVAPEAGQTLRND